MQVPILCMRHGKKDTMHSVYESIICNELLEVRSRKAQDIVAHEEMQRSRIASPWPDAHT